MKTSRAVSISTWSSFSRVKVKSAGEASMDPSHTRGSWMMGWENIVKMFKERLNKV